MENEIAQITTEQAEQIIQTLNQTNELLIVIAGGIILMILYGAFKFFSKNISDMF